MSKTGLTASITIPDNSPSERVTEFVIAHYGKWADRVLGETKDPRFLNPIIGVSVQDGVVYNRLREYWSDGCATSVSRPEPGSLTEEYMAKGLIVFRKNEYAFANSKDTDLAAESTHGSSLERDIRPGARTKSDNKLRAKNKRSKINLIVQQGIAAVMPF